MGIAAKAASTEAEVNVHLVDTFAVVSYNFEDKYRIGKFLENGIYLLVQQLHNDSIIPVDLGAQFIAYDSYVRLFLQCGDEVEDRLLIPLFEGIEADIYRDLHGSSLKVVRYGQTEGSGVTLLYVELIDIPVCRVIGEIESSDLIVFIGNIPCP
jgi:hypothetical protein